MNTKIKNKGARRFAPWTAVLSLLVAIVLVAPAVVFAQTYELSQDCDFALVNNEHTITAKVTDGDVPVANVTLFYLVFGAHTKFAPTLFGTTNADGIAEFTFTGVSTSGTDTIKLVPPPPGTTPLAEIVMTWTEDEAELCSTSQQVLVGGRLTLNPNKKGALNIAVCGSRDLEVSNVDPKSVQLAGVPPWHWKQKDSRLCPDGKDGVKDLVLKFKNREVIEALGPDLEDVDEVPLALTGNLIDGTAFGGEWVAEIKKEGKRHQNKYHHKKEDKKDKGKGSHK